MARITQVSDTAAAPEAAALFTAIKAKIGMVPNLYRVAANQPKVLAAMLGLNETLAGGGFDARTREAIALTVAGANACDYCASAHAAISAGLKVAPETIDAHLAGRSDDPRTAAILKLASPLPASIATRRESSPSGPVAGSAMEAMPVNMARSPAHQVSEVGRT